MSLSAGAARARHDLGRYVAMQTRFVGVEGPIGDLRDALDSDLLHTRRGPDADLDVAAVWAAVRLDLVGADTAPIDELVAELARRAALLPTLAEAEVRATAALALRCADATRALHRQLAETP